MARLPGINYTAGVPSLGRHDVTAPVRVANAQAAALGQLGVAAGKIGDAYKAIQVEKGENQLADAASILKRGEQEIRNNPNIEERDEELEDLRRSIGEELTSGLSGTAAKAFNDRWDPWSQNVADGLAVDNIKELYTVEKNLTIDSSRQMAKDGNAIEAFARVDGSKLLSEVEKTEIKKQLRFDHAAGDLERTSISGDADAIADLLGEIKDKDYTGPFEGSNRNAAINQLESAFKTATAASEARVAHEREQFANELEIGVRTGNRGLLDIQAAFDERDINGDTMITGPKKTQLEMIYYTREDDLQTQYEQLQLVGNVDGPLDRENTDHVDAVDFAYDDYAARNADDPQKVQEYGVNLASRTNILPESLEADIRRMAFAGSPQAVQDMANVYEVLEREAPQVLDGIGSQEKAIYKSTMAFLRGGGNLDDSVERARENAYKDPNEKRILRERYSIEFSPNVSEGMAGFQSWLDSENQQFDVSRMPWTGAPLATNANYAAYRSMEAEYWTNTNGDPGLTRQFAREDYKRLFSTTNVNSKGEIMPYAPEREYNVPVGDDTLMKDLHSYYKAEDIADEFPFIMSDARTARDPIGARTYAVYTMDEFNNPQLHEKRWKMNTDEAYQQRQKEAQKEQDASRRRDKALATEVRQYP